MSGISSSLVSPPRYRNLPPRPRSEDKRAKIIDAAMRHFAEHGYHAARVGDIAAGMGIAKGSIFQHFGSKDGLFFETYKKAVYSFSPYLKVPPEVRVRGLSKRSGSDSNSAVSDRSVSTRAVSTYVSLDRRSAPARG